MEQVQTVQDVRGREVLTAHALIAPLGWFVFVELPVEEAYEPLFGAMLPSFGLLLAGLALAFLGIGFFFRASVGGRSARWWDRAR